MPKMFGFYALTPRAKIVLVALISVVLLTTGVMYVQANHKLKPIYEVKTDKKVVALTFDISWGNNTPCRLSRYSSRIR